MRGAAAVLLVLGLVAAACGSGETPNADPVRPDHAPMKRADPAVDLQFRPVLAVGPPASSGSSERPTDATTPAATATATVLSRSGDLRLETGPAATTAADVESAMAERSPNGEWSVVLVITPPGSERFNAIASACFEHEVSCPTGQLAIVVDGVSLSEPTIQAPSFERDRIQISGGFGEAEARELADGLSGA